MPTSRTSRKASFVLGIVAIASLATMFERGVDPAVAQAAATSIFAILDEGNLDRLRTALRDGADPNVRDRDGATPLIHITHDRPLNWTDLAGALIDAGANVNARDNLKESAADKALMRGRMNDLHFLVMRGADMNGRLLREVLLLGAAATGDLRAVRGALAEGIDPNVPAVRSKTSYPVGIPVTLAARRGDHEMLAALLAAGADPNLGGDDREKALGVAVSRNDAAMVRQLLQFKADPNGGPPVGYTPLMGAASTRRKEIVQILLAGGADVNATWDGKNATSMAAALGDSETVELLLKGGAKVDEKQILGLLLVAAARRNDRALAADLLARGASSNAQARDRSGPAETPLLASVTSGTDQEALVRLLLDHGADPNIRGPMGMSALGKAAGTNGLKVIQLLLERRADPKLRDDAGTTPLMIAARQTFPNAEIVRTLIAAGSEVNAVDRQGKSVLETAVLARNTEAVQLLERAGARGTVSAESVADTALLEKPSDVHSLVAIGANVNAVDERGLSVLMRVARYGRTDAVRTLLSEGADVNQQTADGWSALTYAAYGGHVEVVRLLLSSGADPNARIKEGSLLLLAARHMVVALVAVGGGGAVTPAAPVEVSGGGLVVKPALPVNTATRPIEPPKGPSAPGMIVLGAPSAAGPESRNAAIETATRGARAAEAAIIEELLQHRADPNRGDEDGLTPLMYAAARGRTDLVDILIRHGAKVDARSIDGITPWQVATGDEVIRRLGQARARR